MALFLSCQGTGVSKLHETAARACQVLHSYVIAPHHRCEPRYRHNGIQATLVNVVAKRFP